MKIAKLKIKNSVLIIFIISMFFVFGVTKSFAGTNLVGSIDMSVENQVKVCKDNTCINPKPGIIYFKVSSDSPLVIDTEKGLSGKVWGDELGWITFNPPYGGVFFADVETGLLKGTAWSETSGAINFSVTGQKVIIDPQTGEWNGWAWASGPYGGWIKFDCKDATSCVRTIWNKEAKASTSPTPDIGKNEGQSLPTGQAGFSKTFSSSFANLFNVIGQKFSNAYNFVAIYLANVFSPNFFVNKIDEAVSPAIEIEEFPVLTDITEVQPSPKLSLGENIKNVFQEKKTIMTDNFNALVTSSADLFNQMTNVKYKIFDKAGDSYYTFSSNLIDLRGSVLEGINNLIK